MFIRLEQQKPDHFAVRQHKKYKAEPNIWSTHQFYTTSLGPLYGKMPRAATVFARIVRAIYLAVWRTLFWIAVNSETLSRPVIPLSDLFR